MKLLVLTSIYPADDIPSTFTPVVHYFVKEWIKQGHDVKVFHSAARFPKIFYSAAKILGAKFLSSKLGFTIMETPLDEKRYSLDGADVLRKPIGKLVPHGRFPASEISRQTKAAFDFCRQDNFTPDVIVGHWLNPQLELIAGLSEFFPKAKTALTLHGSARAIKDFYKYKAPALLAKVGKIGARSFPARAEILESLKIPEDRVYTCFSGIPEIFIDKDFSGKSFGEVANFAFVGTLFKRKYPEALLQALLKIGKKNFSLVYAGGGEMAGKISEIAGANGVSDKVKLLGKIPRGQIRDVLEKADCFAMISKNEVYGLVYLEAMARGCITIASKREGFDGIIKDGENGFLCDAGNADELAKIFEKIMNTAHDKLAQISQNAARTAKEMTDAQCAKNYLAEISQ